MRFFLILLTCLGCYLPIIGSENKDFNQRYEEVSVSLAATNIKQAQLVADSLSRVAANDEQRIKAYMLSANLYLATGDIGDAIKGAMQANQIAVTALNTYWQAMTSGFLATAFRSIGLMQASERYLASSDKANEKNPEGPMYVLTKINLLHERAFHKFEINDYTAAETILQEARQLIVYDEFESKKSTLIKATNSQLLGHCYLHLGHLTIADSMLHETLSIIGNVESNLQPYTYRTIAEVEMQKGNLKKAFKYLNMTLPYLGSVDGRDLSILVYQSFAEYYKRLGNPVISNGYKLKVETLKNQRTKLANQVSNMLFEKLTTVKEDYKNKYKLVIILVLCLVFGLVTILMYLYLLNKKQPVRSNLGKDLLIENNHRTISDSLQPQELHSDGEIKIKDIHISEDTEARLLKEFMEQESVQFFLEKSVSLNSLSLALNSNQRYVSYIIHKYRGQDFYAYIQSKRIAFIVDRLRQDEALLDYKLSHLAEISGFSNHSKFSIAFKNEMGLPPSAFVHLLKNEKSAQQL